TRFQSSPSITIGRFSMSTSASLNRTELMQAAGIDADDAPYIVPESVADEGSFSASASYQQQLVGTTTLSPNISLSRRVVRDSLTHGAYMQGPTRLSFGANLNTDLYGFFP